MKITKQGLPPEKRVYCGRCSYCKTEIEFERGEAEVIHDPWDGGYLRVKCPLCKQYILVQA